MLARLSAFVIWALVAATAVFWGLRLMVRAPAAPAYAVPVGDAATVRGDLTRLLGSAPVVTAAAAPVADANSRFRLLGIMAPKSSPGVSAAYGVALIAIDGKMPKAFAVGSRVDGELLLQSVSLRTVSIGPGQGAPTVMLELPPLAAAATGKLPMGTTGGAYVAPPPMPAPAPMTQFSPQPVPQVPPPPIAAPARPEQGVPVTPAQ